MKHVTVLRFGEDHRKYWLFQVLQLADTKLYSLFLNEDLENVYGN